ncbi:MAG: DUF1476 domain-containing protein [Alphaproteobacteria bacterium]
MPTTFDERRKSFEKKFTLDQDLRFKATVRRNKLLGLWAAEKMGMSQEEADAYAKDVVKSDFQKIGDEDVIGKVLSDFAAKNITYSAENIQETLDVMMGKAVVSNF